MSDGNTTATCRQAGSPVQDVVDMRRLSASATTQLALSLSNLQNYERYRITASLSATQATSVRLTLLGGGTYQDPIATNTVSVGTSATPLTIEGIYVPGVGDNPSAASLAIFLRDANVKVSLAGLKIERVPYNPIAPLSSGGSTLFSVPYGLMGYHALEIGTHWSPLSLGQQVFRLWDTGTAWNDVQPNSGPGGYNFDRLNAVLGYLNSQAVGVKPLLVLGSTPAWAATATYPPSEEIKGTGSSTVPSTANWEAYITKMRDTYQNTISMWEVWNEWDIPQMFHGDAQQMKNLTCSAYNILKGTGGSSNNKVLSPSFTVSLTALDAFLKAGGAQCVDAIAVHAYTKAANPEVHLAAQLANVRLVMNQNNVPSTMPIWNTESGIGNCVDRDLNCGQAGATISTTRQRGLIPRVIATTLANKVSNYMQYFMEGNAYFLGMGVKGAVPPGDGHGFQFTGPTEFGKGYQFAANWLTGYTLGTKAYMQGSDVFIYRFWYDNTKESYMVWTTSADGKRVTVPAAWKITSVNRIGGQTDALPSYTSSFDLAPDEPVILTP